MSRILATGDWHVGSGLDYGATPQDRLDDQERVIEQIVEFAIEHDVDVLAIAGDVWHRRRPTPAELMVVARPLRRLRFEHQCDIVAIAGNHCVESFDSPIALDLFEDILDVYKRPAVARTRAGAFAMLPWTPVSRLVAARDGHESRDRTHEEAAAMLVAAARGLRAEIPAETPAVLLGHWSLTGASTPTGAITDDFREVVLDVDDLAELGFDGVLFGHIHRAAAFQDGLGWTDPFLPPAKNRPFLYTGSPLPVDFGEARTPHGCWLIDLGHAATAEFVPISSRPFVTVDVDLTADRHVEGEETAAIGLAIGTHDIDDAVVKVRYRATEEQARRIDWPTLRTLLEDAHKVFSITGDIVRSERARVDGMDEDIAPLVAVEAWCGANEIADSARLAELSARYLQEVGA